MAPVERYTVDEGQVTCGLGRGVKGLQRKCGCKGRGKVLQRKCSYNKRGGGLEHRRQQRQCRRPCCLKQHQRRCASMEVCINGGVHQCRCISKKVYINAGVNEWRFTSMQVYINNKCCIHKHKCRCAAHTPACARAQMCKRIHAQKCRNKMTKQTHQHECKKT